jgi:WD40 repeat protein
MLADVARQPGALPLLQHALLELWERRQGRLLTLVAYQASGGVVGAISQRADSVYDGLNTEEQVAVRRIMLRLTQPGQGTEDTRRRVRRRELLSGSPEQQATVEEVLLRLADARLITTSRDMASGEEMVDVAHEALIRGWARLRNWIDQDRMALHVHRQLTEAAETWQGNDRDTSYLYHGGRLAQAQELRKAYVDDLNALERAFLSASQEAAESVEREREAGRQRELAQMQALLAEQQRRIEAQAQAHSLHLATSARLVLYEHNTDLALALALEANRVDDPTPLAQLVLAEAAYAPGTRRVFEGHTAAVHGLAVGPGGQTLLSASADHTLILWDVETGGIVRHLRGHKGGVSGVAITPDGRRAISGSIDQTLILWDLETGECIRHFVGHGGSVRCVAITPDGQRVVSGATDQTLILWDLETGKLVHRLKGHCGPVVSVAISPDGRTALSGSEDRSVALWDLDTGRLIRRMRGHDKAQHAQEVREGHFDSVWGVVFFPDGKRALSISEDEFGIEWDLDTGRVNRFWRYPVGMMSVHRDADGNRALLGTLDSRVTIFSLDSGEMEMQLLGHSGRVSAVAFGPDGRTAFSGATDGTLRLWNLRSGAEVRCMEYQDPLLPAAVAISPDGRMGLTGFWFGDLVLWDYQSGETICRLVGHTETLFAGVAFLPDGRTALSGAGDIFAQADDSTLRLWDVHTGQEIRRFEGHTKSLYDVDLAPDGRFAVSVSDDGTVRAWDLKSGSRRVLLDLSPQAARSVAISPDGRTALIGLGKGTSDVPDYALRLLDLRTGEELCRYCGHKDAVAGIAFSPDGCTALSGGLDKVVILWDVESGAEIQRFMGHAGACMGVAFGPDGRYAFSSGYDGSIVMWDVADGVAIRRLVGSRSIVVDFALAPGERTILSACDDYTVREWRVDATQEQLLAWIAANRYVPELTAQQRKQYQIESREA